MFVAIRYWRLPFLVTPGIRRDGTITVLLINGHAVFLHEVVKELHALSVLLVILRIYTDNGMKALASAMNECRDRQLQLAEDDILFRDRERIRLHQGEAQSRHVLVLYATAIKGIEANPRADFGFPVTDRCAEVVGMLFERCDEFPGGAVIHALAGSHLPSASCHTSFVT